MYKGFNLKIDFTEKDKKTYYEKGQSLYESSNKNVRAMLKDLILTNGNFDGSKMQENWFPQIAADIFISHSHRNEDDAITLAGWLKSSFGITSFIDSCIWGYSNDLLKLLDNKLCLQTDGYYNYNRRNNSTSHVHMMLSTALNMMIDNTECLFFINTPDSISTTNAINSTLSPWIYAEITMSKLIRKKKLFEYRKSRIKKFSKGGIIELNENFEYKLDIDHLTDLDLTDLNNWLDEYDDLSDNENHPLDTLYRQHSFNDSI